ncbi:MAG: MarC family protein [Bacteroidetes bacterium]|nr:MarC family protein [Bacteroidota bacterium]
MEDFVLAFIPIFVAIDVIGIVPVYLTLTDGIPDRAKKRVLRQSTITAFAVSLMFLAVGKVVFTFLGITISDFKIAGGIILFAIAINDLLFSTTERKQNEVKDETKDIEIHHAPSIGVVPIGIPLIVGPALLTTLMILIDTHGILPTVTAVVLNLLIVYVALRFSSGILRLIGRSGADGIAKVVTILLAAIGVMMVRQGITDFIAG